MKQKLREYEVFRENCREDVVAVIRSFSLWSAVAKAKKMGYGEGFRVEEAERYE